MRLVYHYTDPQYLTSRSGIRYVETPQEAARTIDLIREILQLPDEHESFTYYLYINSGGQECGQAVWDEWKDEQGDTIKEYNYHFQKVGDNPFEREFGKSGILFEDNKK
jgi:hypothetical protein